VSHQHDRFICRNKSVCLPGIEVTLSYEDVVFDRESYAAWVMGDQDDEAHSTNERTRDKRYGLRLNGCLGGSLTVADCVCGYPFCCGDLSRRFASHCLREEDYFLLYVDQYAPFVFMSRLVQLNLKYIDDNRDALKENPLQYTMSVDKRREYIHCMFASENEVLAASSTKDVLEAIFNIGCQTGNIVETH